MTNSPFAEVAERLFVDLAARPGVAGLLADWSAIDATELDRLLLPEDDGGAGDAFEDACAIMAVFGRRGPNVPLLETMVANWLLAHSGLPVERGPKALLVASDIGPIRLEGDHFMLPSEPVAVTWMPMTTTAVVLAEDETGALQVAMVARPQDGADGQTLADEPARWLSGRALRLSGPAQPLQQPRALALALPVLLQASAMTGAIEAAIAMTLDHANLRKQFGRPIAAFQAVQHMAARMACAGAVAAASVEQAKNSLLTPQALWFAAVSKSATSEAAGTVAADAHQIHGAIGFTREYNLHRHTRRLWAWRERYGNEEYWNSHLGGALLKSADTSLWRGVCEGLSI
ncbi:acyl-CoA dehydrogenase family protein [Pararhodobacter sp.]|uniref:acyl-CoA dehydrogenase family protein n=1 Tax=Pararhodobacter sp. TaxID=2127056 RepID=UPI002FDE31E1